MGNNLREREGGSIGIVTASNDLEVGSDRSEVVISLSIGKVSEAKGLTDLSWREKLLELYNR